MTQSILNILNLDPKSIGQTVTSTHGFISIFDLKGNVLDRLFPDESQSLDQLKLSLYDELKATESDPRSFINTENEDLIRCSIIGRVEHITNFGVAIFNKQGKLIHYCHEPINDCCEDIIGQIEGYPTLPKEDWNPCPMSDDPEGFIEPINWELTSFYGFRS